MCLNAKVLKWHRYWFKYADSKQIFFWFSYKYIWHARNLYYSVF